MATSEPIASVSIDDFLARNRETAKSHEPMPFVADLSLSGGLTIFLTCTDPRVFPERILGLRTGEALVYRCVGGRAAPLARDMAALSAELPISGIMVVHHTDCGASHFKDDGLREKLVQRAPHRAAELERATFGAFDDLEEGVRADVRLLRSYDLFEEHTRKNTRGFVFDIKTGLLNEVLVQD